ncbi:outer dense fiber protein 4-like [Tamandua tetradactyla]|uniref:outer dense fiber protein 4-like n=1 Tax=Tamandua tetradactyla TaxID=48850 RepID=UPI0040547E87
MISFILVFSFSPESLKEWTGQPFFEVAKISFWLAVGLGFVLTVWLHLPYLPGLERPPSFGWIATIMSFCEVIFIFSTLILFPINLWIFELKRNLSIPIGWSYFIGWLVLILYVTCAILCHFNQKSFWSLDLKGPSDTVSCSRSCGSARDTQKKEQNVSAISSTQAEILKPVAWVTWNKFCVSPLSCLVVDVNCHARDLGSIPGALIQEGRRSSGLLSHLERHMVNTVSSASFFSWFPVS